MKVQDSEFAVASADAAEVRLPNDACKVTLAVRGGVMPVATVTDPPFLSAAPTPVLPFGPLGLVLYLALSVMPSGAPGGNS